MHIHQDKDYDEVHINTARQCCKSMNDYKRNFIQHCQEKEIILTVYYINEAKFYVGN